MREDNETATMRGALTELITKSTAEILELYNRAHSEWDDNNSRSELLSMAATRKKALDSLWEAARMMVDS